MTTRQEPFASLGRRSRFDLTVMLLLGTIAVAGAWLYREFAQDDAFISYRYSANLANGLGFVYNRGEAVLGTSTPLYVLILAALAKVTGLEVRIISHLVSVTSLWASAMLLYVLGRSYARLEAAAVALVFISNALLLSAIGMETLFLLALLLLSLKCYIANRLTLAGFLLGLLVVTRYEMALFAGLLAMHFAVQHRRLPIWLLAAVPPVAVWIGYAWPTFGTIIPTSATAKLVERGASHGAPFGIGAILWWYIYGSNSVWYYALLPLVLLGSYMALRKKRQHQPYRLLLAWSVIYFVAASLAALSFSWYYGPLIPGFAILVIWGVECLSVIVGILSQKLRLARMWQTALRFGIFALLAVGILALQISSWTDQYWLTSGDRVLDARFLLYREIAQWLNDHGNEQQSVAAAEIGVLGYYTDMRIIDFHGLVTPELVPWLPYNGMERLIKAVEIHAPDYILANNPGERQYIENLGDYDLAEVFADRTFFLYKRKAGSLVPSTALSRLEEE